MHQCAYFMNDPKLSHKWTVKCICKYLQGMQDCGIIYHPDKSKGIECFVDANFVGAWDQADAQSAENVMSRTGFAIFYAGCPILWCSKLQMEIALSMTEVEYIALS